MNVDSAELTQVPNQMENPSAPVPDMPTPTPGLLPETKPDIPPEKKPSEENPPEKKPDPLQSLSPLQKKFLEMANWVIDNEAKKLGTACNFYIERVLMLTGFSNEGFLANDFDVYATHHFSSVDRQDFNAGKANERQRLHDFIWSFAENTPFIFQWTRVGKPGHIAIVQRVGESLVIYQASLGEHIPRKEQTKVDLLLGAGRENLTVYVNFKP